MSNLPASGPAVDGGQDTSLYSELDESLGHLVRRSLQLQTAIWSESVEGDLTPPQYAILDALAARGSLDQRSIGLAASFDKSTVADVLSRLERNGWVRRDRDPDAARRMLFQLTPPARAAMPRIAAQAREVDDRLLAPLVAEERDELVVLLARAASIADAQPESDSNADPESDPEVVPAADADTEVTASVLQLLRRAEQFHQRVWSRRVGNLATPTQYAVFCALHGNVVDQRTLASLASLDTSNTANIVSRLAGLSLIVADRDPEDRRRNVVSLTANALELLVTLTPLARSVHDEVSSALTAAESSRLMSLLRRVAYRERV